MEGGGGESTRGITLKRANIFSFRVKKLFPYHLDFQRGMKIGERCVRRAKKFYQIPFRRFGSGEEEESRDVTVRDGPFSSLIDKTGPRGNDYTRGYVSFLSRRRRNCNVLSNYLDYAALYSLPHYACKIHNGQNATVISVRGNNVYRRGSRGAVRHVDCSEGVN